MNRALFQRTWAAFSEDESGGHIVRGGTTNPMPSIKGKHELKQTAGVALRAERRLVGVVLRAPHQRAERRGADHAVGRDRQQRSRGDEELCIRWHSEAPQLSLQLQAGLSRPQRWAFAIGTPATSLRATKLHPHPLRIIQAACRSWSYGANGHQCAAN